MLAAGGAAEALDQGLLVYCELIAALGTFHLIKWRFGAIEILIDAHALLRLAPQIGRAHV